MILWLFDFSTNVVRICVAAAWVMHVGRHDFAVQLIAGQTYSWLVVSRGNSQILCEQYQDSSLTFC